jgi:transcription factor SPN1
LAWLIGFIASKLRLDMQIEAILKPKKAGRSKKRSKDEEVLDRFADEEVSRLREAMIQAADEDIRANREKLPALSKLRLLPEVMQVLRKSVQFVVPFTTSFDHSL